MTSGFVAGSGKSVLWCVTQLISVEIAYIVGQFINREGHRGPVHSWISLGRILLF